MGSLRIWKCGLAAGILLAFCCGTLRAAAQRGNSRVDSLEIAFLHFDNSWSGTESGAGNFVVEEDGSGSFLLRGGEKLELRRTLQEIAPGQWRHSYRFRSGTTIHGRQFAVNLKLPAGRYAGKILKFGERNVKIPVLPKAGKLYEGTPGSMQIPLEHGEVSIFTRMPVLVQDDRIYQAPNLVVRLLGDLPESGTKQIAFSFETKFIPGRNALGTVLPDIVTAGKEYLPLEYPGRVRENSALDLSFLLDAPAGKYGRVMVSGKDLVFADRRDRPVRFWGTNLIASANFPDRRNAVALADELARAGYNAVRFHHFDYQLVAEDGSFLPEQLDRMDFLAAELIRRGIYVTLDLFSARTFPEGAVPEAGRALNLSEFKSAMYVSERAFQLWEAFAVKLLNHVNPYTGRAWKEEPALLGIALVNENNISRWFGLVPRLREIYQAEFERWRRGRSFQVSGERQFQIFLVELYARLFERMKKVVRDTGCLAPLSDQNMRADIALEIMRGHYDYVDNHFYWDHPVFLGPEWTLPATLGNRSMVNAALTGLNYMSVTRLSDRPFLVTEFNWAYPNRHRGESGLLTATVAGLQGWNGLFRFAFAHGLTSFVRPQPMNFFDTSRDPVNMLSDRFGALLFLRRGVREAAARYEIGISPELLLDPLAPEGYPPELARLGLLGVVSSTLSPTAASWKLSEESRKRAEKLTAASELRTDTGEIRINVAKGEFQLDTPEAVGAVFPGTGRMEFQQAAVTNLAAHSVCVMLSSLDERPLGESNRILLLTLADVQNSGAVYRDRSRTEIVEFGTLPLLAEKNRLRIRLKRGDGIQVFAMDLSGNRLFELPVDFETGAVSFSIEDRDTPVLAWEIVTGAGATEKK